jgi:hypothetical protein
VFTECTSARRASEGSGSEKAENVPRGQALTVVRRTASAATLGQVHRGDSFGGQGDREVDIALASVSGDLQTAVLELTGVAEYTQLGTRRVLRGAELEPLAVGVGVVLVDQLDSCLGPGSHAPEGDREGGGFGGRLVGAGEGVVVEEYVDSSPPYR